MKKLAAALFGVIVAASFAASAASLKVDAGVLQVWSYEIDICADDPGRCPPPQDERGNIRVELLFLNNGGQVQGGFGKVFERDFSVSEAQEYSFEWDESGRGTFAACPAGVIDGREAGPGPFTTRAGVVDHVLCLRGSSGSYNNTTADPSKLHISVEVAAAPDGETESGGSLADAETSGELSEPSIPDPVEEEAGDDLTQEQPLDPNEDVADDRDTDVDGEQPVDDSPLVTEGES